MHSLADDCQGEHAKRVSQDLKDLDESEKEVASISREHLEDMEGSPNNSEETDGEVKTNFQAEVSEGIESTPQDAQKGDIEEESHSEEKGLDESKAMREEAHNDKSDSEGNQDAYVGSSRRDTKKHRKEPSKPLDAGDAEISDDEPLVLPSSFAFILCIMN